MYRIKYFLILLVVGLHFTGCDDFLGDNRDPDATDKVPVDQIMPTVLFYSALQNYDHGEYGSYLAQTLTTAGKSQTGSYAYKQGWEFLSMNRHPQWRRHFYDVGSNARELIKLANEEGSANYTAISRLLVLQSTQVTTDVFGAMPRSDAYMSSSPAYDSQESIYEYMRQEADDVIALFDNPNVKSETNRPMEVKVDRVFAGDMDKWKQVAYGVKARILLRQLPNLNTSASVCNEIITTAETALNGWTDPVYKFDGGNSIEKNCMWGRNNKPINSWESRANELGGAIPTKFFVEDIMRFDPNLPAEIKDPRLPRMMEPRADASAVVTYRNLESNSGMPASHKIEWYPNMYACALTTDKSDIIILTKGELHFIVSEAAFWADDKVKAVDHLKEGIRYHMARLKVSQDSIDTYVNDPDLVPGTANITLHDIMKEKYIAMYLQPEQWNDMRRYGYSNSDNDRRYLGSIIYPNLERPHNLYEAYWGDNEDWLQRINYDPETEEKYSRPQLIELGAFRNSEWLKKPMIWAPQN